MPPDVRLQPLTRARLASLGEAGRAWAADLPELLETLQRQWDVTLEGRGLPGGSASWVGRARADDGTPVVIKVAVPGHPLAAEAHLLSLAEGRGLVRLLAHDPVADAVLLESLGPSLSGSRLPLAERLDHQVAALRQVWALPTAGFDVPAAGEDKASSLARLVLDTDRRLDHPTPAPVLAAALDAAGRRAADHRPEHCVVVHGDPHAANALAVPGCPARGPGVGTPAGPGDRQATGGELAYRFVDPDGFLADPAYDLGVLLRDLGDLGERPAERLLGWCRHLARAGGQPTAAVWDWALLERVSTGLHVLGFGGGALGKRLLDSAVPLVGPGPDG